MKTYQIYASSSEAFAGTDPNKKVYKFDWNIIPEGEYEFSFALSSRLIKVTAAQVDVGHAACQVQIEVPFSSDRYECNDTGYASSTQKVGFIHVEDHYVFANATHVMRRWAAKHSDNAPIKMYGRPQGDSFVVSLLTQGEVFGSNMADYDLCITLKRC